MKQQPEQQAPPVQRLRVRYAKRGRLRFTSHRDFSRAFERAVFRAWQELGLRDAYRLFEQPEKTFSWWDYRQLSFPKNAGLRIDHILLSPQLAMLCTACRIDRQARKGQKPSDHAPVIAELDLDLAAAEN